MNETDWIIKTLLIPAEIVALLWVLHAPFVIITGYYFRDRSKDEG